MLLLRIHSLTNTAYGTVKRYLQQQRKRNFVGRQKEISFFEQLLAEKEPSVHLIYVYGPGGQGKTTLLKQFADLCKESSVPLIQFDCRYIESHPDSFRLAFQAASPFAYDLMDSIDSDTGNVVLLIDTYEKLKPLDDQELSYEESIQRTYRRQVKKGVERIADMLWMEEQKGI